MFQLINQLRILSRENLKNGMLKKSLHNLRVSNPASQELEPVDLSLPIMKEHFSGWLVDMFNYFRKSTVCNKWVYSCWDFKGFDIA